MKNIVFFICALISSSAISQQDSDPNTRHMLLRDEGLSQLSYVDLGHSGNNWIAAVPPGRDLQLIGHGLVLIGTGMGFEEREIKTGSKIFEIASFKGTLTARRLRNGNTLLSGVNWQDKKGIALVEIDKAGVILKIINYPAFDYVRLVRETESGTFLITSDTVVFEGDTSGSVLWQAQITSSKKPHAWQAVRLANGLTVVSCGFAANFQIFNKDGSLARVITGPDEVNPNYFAGFQIMQNGNMVVTNWQGHGSGNGTKGIQLLEYTESGKLVWSWKQDANNYSSLQGVIILDGLDLNTLHIEDASGKLAPVNSRK